MSQPRSARMGHARGNIGAAILLMALWFFRRAAAYQKKILGATPAEEGYCPFGAAISALAPFLYAKHRIFICNLNDMRSKHGSSDWRCASGLRGRKHRRQNQVP